MPEKGFLKNQNLYLYVKHQELEVLKVAQKKAKFLKKN